MVGSEKIMFSAEKKAFRGIEMDWENMNEWGERKKKTKRKKGERETHRQNREEGKCREKEIRR
jgi:hypothetical protein